MGSGISRQGSGPSRRAGPHQRRRAGMKRAISSIFICGASSRQMEGYPDELLVNSSEHDHQEKLKFTRKFSRFSLGNGPSRSSIKTESAIPSGKGGTANKNPAAEDDASHGGPGDNRKYLCEKREFGRSDKSVDYSRGNEIASTSYADQPYPCHLPADEMSGMDAGNGQNCNMPADSSQIGEGRKNSSIDHSHTRGESLFDEVSVENNCSEKIDLVNSDFGSSFVPESPVDLHILRDEIHHEGTPSGLGLLVTEREQTRQDSSLTQFDVVGISTNMSRTNSVERSTHDARRNSRRLFWDAFSRRSSRSRTDSRTFVLSPGDSDHFRSRDRWLLDFSGSFSNEEVEGDLRSSRTSNSNVPLWSSRSEIWERLRGGLESADHPGVICPRGIHADGSCSCLSRTSNEETTARAGISRIIMLAEALFEVLDQIHQQPMSLSLSVVSHPAPASIVDSFPVKTHRKAERLESVDDVSQCYICLAEYEDGDRIRVLPCHHEYHMFCVDKWLKEVHGVCPLCRGDIQVASTGGPTST